MYVHKKWIEKQRDPISLRDQRWEFMKKNIKVRTQENTRKKKKGKKTRFRPRKRPRKTKKTREKKKKENTLDQESKIKEKTIKIKKEEGRKWKTQIRIKHFDSFFRYIQFGRIDK